MTDLYEVMGYYHYLVLKHESGRTSFPAEDRFMAESQTSNAVKVRSRIEDEKAFIGDVGLFIKRLVWFERLIFTSRFVPHGKGRKSWQRIVIDLRSHRRKTGQIYPSRLNWRSHVSREFRKICKGAEDYFVAKGYIRAPQRQDVNAVESQ